MFFNLMGVVNESTSSSSSSSPPTQTNVSCTCNCKRSSTSLQSMEISQLEFVQILVIVVVMLVMVVVITCLLNHYRLSARSLLSRHAHARRRHLPLANEGSLWSSESPATGSGLNEQHQVYTPRPPDRGVPVGPSYLQRDPHTHPHHHHHLQQHHHHHQHHHGHLHHQQRSYQPTSTYPPSRFQPTYPYLPQSLIDLPPTISLSDGEEPPPYQGPCTLQLRDPEQQLELNRESVRAPPNRTVYDSHLLLHASSSASTSCLQASLQAPPPSVHAGISASEGQLEASSRLQQKQGSGVEGTPPPAYSEVIGHYYHPTSLPHPHPDHTQHRTVPAALPSQAPGPPSSSLIHGGLLRPLPPLHSQQPAQQAPPTPGTSVANRNARNTKEKSSHKPQQV